MILLQGVAHRSGRIVGAAMMGAAILAFAPAATVSHAADAEIGREIFKRCAACHRLEPDRNAMGPSLYGIVGREAGSVAGFRYSDALRKADFVWTPEQLDRWLANPKALVPGNRMPFPGMPRSEDRKNLIEFLRQSGG